MTCTGTRSRRRTLPWLVRVVLLLGLGAGRAHAQSAENILLVINESSAVSQQIGDHYARTRAIPGDNILRLVVDKTEEVPRAIYQRQIEAPIASWIARQAAHDRLLYIVLTKDIPLRIAGTSGRNGTIASVDSELTLLYRRLLGQSVSTVGTVPNPYFLGDRPLADAKPFTHENYDVYLVARLDGFSLSDVLALIDRGAAPVRTGRVALDEKLSLKEEAGNQWLQRAAEILQHSGPADRVVFDATGRTIASEGNLLGYYSWGSNDPSITSRHLKLGFVPGALAAEFVSTDARTFRAPPEEWTLGRWEDQKTYFAGSPQSLIGDLIHDGATGVAGHVAEPYLDATIRPDVLFPAYLTGFNLVESYYLSMPYLSWQTVVVGDPLCAPFRARTIPPSEIDRGLDPATELPSSFSARAFALVAPKSPSIDGRQAMLRARTRAARGDAAGSRQALEQAIAADAHLIDAQVLLAALYDQAGDHIKAIQQYRAALAASPNDAEALNNLAYLLATTQPEALPEALALARKARGIARGSASVADTLAWVLHLSGGDREARTLLAAVMRAAPDNAVVQLHAAVIDAALGTPDAASQELARALQLNPELAKELDATRLIAILGRPKP